MLVFRSEECVDRWLDQHDLTRGASMSLSRLWAMVQLWYDGRLTADWRGLAPDRAQAILDQVGLTGDAWRIV